MLRDNVIVPTTIEAHGERSTRAAFVYLEQNSLSARCALDQLLYNSSLRWKHLSVSLGILNRKFGVS